MKPQESPPELGLEDVLLAADEEKGEMDKVMEIILDPKNIAHLTALTRNEITAFSVLATMTERHKLPVLQDFLAKNLLYRVSKDRQGRKELTKIMSRQLEATQMEEIGNPRGFGRFFGRNKNRR